MPKVLKDEALIDRFLNRGVEQIYPSAKELRNKLMSGERLRVYQGFDPTGPYLHIGHAIGIRALSILQKLGHEVIFLVGDFTGKIGDPDKSNTREILSDAKIERNMSGWKKQAGNLIDFGGSNPVKFERNSKWLSRLRFEDVLRLASNVTVQQMIERDLFEKRLDRGSPIKLHEFLYPVMQGYDSVAMGVDLEIGGTDQTFNMLIGRQLVKNYLNKEKFVRTNIMMEAPNSLTMSKTKGNGINLSDSAEEMYGKAMSYPDELITKGLELLTDLPIEQIDDIEREIENDVNPMQFKKLMAYEIVKIVKGEKEAKKAQGHFEETVQEGKVPEDLILVEAKPGMTVLETISLALGDRASASEIKRVIRQGGVEVNGIKVADTSQKLENNPGDIIKFGKRDFIKVV